MKPILLFAVVQPGLEPITRIELNKANINNFIEYRGGFEFYGHHSTIYRLNNTLRTISRILIRFPSFYANSFWELEKNLKKLPFEEFISGSKPVIRVNTSASRLYHKEAVKERVLSSISNLTDSSTSPRNDNPRIIVVNINRDIVQVNVDTTGMHLHKRGWGDWKTRAPLRETIAAAMLISALSKIKIKRLMDPMCGSGTLLLEAGSISRELPHFYTRNFSFENFPSFQENVYERVKSRLYDSIKPLDIELTGTDSNESAIIASVHNMSNLKIGGNVLLQKRDCMTLSEREIKGCAVISNPPYGERLPDRGMKHIISRLQSLRKNHITDYTGLLLPAGSNIGNMHREFRTRNGNIAVIYCSS